MASQPNTIVRLNDFCVAEFWPEQLSMSPNPVFYKLYNNQTGTHHIYNANGSPTMNTMDYSATLVGPGQYVYMNQEVVVPYWQRYPDKFYATTPGTYDTFNRVRFHFSSGFDFADMQGLILSIKNKMNNGGYVVFASILITPDWYSDLVKFNPSPIYLADMIFDRYVEVFVPAVSQINQDYYNVAPELRSTEFGARITYTGTNYSGLVQDAPIVVGVDVVTRIDRVTISDEVYDMCVTDQHNESVIAIDSLHQRFGAFIGESQTFDSLEFYGTFLNENNQLAFAEELINLLSTNAHDDWVIAHQLTIHEWVDGVKTLTGKYMQLQESEFDGPMYYRPILKNAGIAVAFEVDYTCRLYNRRNGDQIIRLASFISYNTAKYGRTLSVLPLADTPQSHVIYNKIVKSSIEATDLFVEQNYVTTGQNVTKNLSSGGSQVTAFIPMFFNVNAISVSMKDALPDSDEVSSTLIYKQGDLRFILNPFDNMFKFKVHTVNNKGRLVPMDLSGYGKFYMVLMNNNKKVKFKYLKDSGTSNPSRGELMFKIPQKDAESLITTSNREFYLTLVASDGTETMLYNGFWNDVTEKDVVDANNEKVRAQQQQILQGQTSSFFSTVLGNLNAGTASIPAQALTLPSDIQIHIPGYVPKANQGGDVSVVHIIPPASLSVSTDPSQAKADSALGKALGNQSGMGK